MAYRMAAARPDLIAAIAPYAAASTPTAAEIGIIIPIIHFHGDADPVVPVSTAKESFDIWIKKAGCGGGSIIQKNDNTTGTRWTTKEGTDLVFYTISGQGHGWPDLDEINMTSIIWDFFRSHPKNKGSHKNYKEGFVPDH